MQKIKQFILLFVSLFFSNAVFSQNVDDVFNPKVSITWLGIDFSEMKFIGPATGWGTESSKSSSEMRDTYFHVWNEFIEKEPKNFKVEQAVGRNEVDMAIGVVRKVNEKANKKDIFSESHDDYQKLEEGDIKKMVKLYDFKGKTGIGFALIAEGMNKNLEEGSFWATFIDMSSKKVLFTKRVTGKAGGFGFRNYWLGSIKSVFKNMKKDFKNWD